MHYSFVRLKLHAMVRKVWYAWVDLFVLTLGFHAWNYKSLLWKQTNKQTKRKTQTKNTTGNLNRTARDSGLLHLLSKCARVNDNYFEPVYINAYQMEQTTTNNGSKPWKQCFFNSACEISKPASCQDTLDWMGYWIDHCYMNRNWYKL